MAGRRASSMGGSGSRGVARLALAADDARPNARLSGAHRVRGGARAVWLIQIDTGATGLARTATGTRLRAVGRVRRPVVRTGDVRIGMLLAVRNGKRFRAARDRHECSEFVRCRSPIRPSPSGRAGVRYRTGRSACGDDRGAVCGAFARIAEGRCADGIRRAFGDPRCALACSGIRDAIDAASRARSRSGCERIDECGSGLAAPHERRDFRAAGACACEP